MLRISAYLASTALAGGLLIATGTGATAQPVEAPGLSALSPPGPFLLSFDENGHATISVNGGPATTLTGTLAADPANPGVGQPLALTFMLPEPVVSGDVSFAEPGTTTISDWLRFTDTAGHIKGEGTGAGTRMLYYSDFEIGETSPDMADTGFPTNLGSGNFLAQLEVGPEGNNGFDYLPGGVHAPLNNEYVGISDAAPEPASLALLGSAMAAMGLAVRRRRR